MAYESIYENFEVHRADGKAIRVAFKKAGFLAGVDQPELYFFEVSLEAGTGIETMVVAILPGPLMEWQRANRYLSREEKIDIAGSFLRASLTAEKSAVAKNFTIAKLELETMIASLGFGEAR